MAISLYDVSVAGFQQTLQGVAAFLDKGAEHFKAAGGSPDQVLDASLAPDMWPFRKQIVSAVHHSRGAIEGVKKGTFSPPTDKTEYDYAGLQKLVADARAALKAVTREEIEALEGKDVTFVLGDFKLPFTVENFLMSFSIPNLHFHATTAYDILRSKGVPVGKRDYTGSMRIKK
ncbi:MAG: DUF1993 domain-containing protein [Beijerinckiaceae bacterium]|mgnify:CR=1 FL=1